MLSLKTKILLLMQAMILSLSGCIQAPQGEAEISSSNPDVIKSLRKKNPSPPVVGNWNGKVGTFINYSTISLNWTASTFANLEKHVLNVYAGSNCSGTVSTYDVFDPNAESYSVSLTDGTYSYNVTVHFDGGQVATTACSGDLYVDTLNPVAGTISSSIPDQSSNIVTVNYTGGSDTFFQKNTLRICSSSTSCNDDANCTSSVIDVDGAISTNITVSGDGSYIACLNTYDQAGNESGWVSSNVFNVDSLTPVPTISVSPSKGFNNPLVTVANLDADGGKLAFYKDASCATILDDNGGSHYSYTAGTTSYAHTIVATLNSGTSYSIYVKQTDNQGNFSCSSSAATYLYDNDAPVIASVSINGGNAYTNSTSISVAYSASDVGNSGVSEICLTESTDVNTCSSAWTTTLTSPQSFSLSSGDNTKYIYLFVKDAAGNISSASSDSIVLDTVAPAVNINSYNGSYLGTCTGVTATTPTNSATIFYSVIFSKAINADSFTITDITNSGTGGSSSLSWGSIQPCGDQRSFLISTSAITGDGTIQPTLAAGVVTDLAGNSNLVSTSSVSNVVEFDSQAPVAATGLNWTGSGASPTASWTPSTSPDLSGQYLSLHMLSGCSDAAHGSSVSLGSGIGSYTFSSLNEASYYFKVKGYDAAGNFLYSECISTAHTVDTTGPTISSVTVPTTSIYIIGDVLTFTVAFNEALSVTNIPALDFDLGGVAKMALYDSGSSTATTMVFKYTVASGDSDSDGILLTPTVNLNGGLIKDASGNNATLTFTSPDTTGITVDGVVPTVNSTTHAASGIHTVGAVLDFIVNFDDVVYVIGESPRINLTIGTDSSKYANYYSGSGTSSLTFRYTVTAGDNDSDGIALATLVELNGASIEDGNSNDASLSLVNYPFATTGIIIDTTAPENATALAWDNYDEPNSKVYNFSMGASWTPSISTDISAQEITFYNSGDCSANNDSPISLLSTDTTQSYTGVHGNTYSFKITTYDNAGNSNSICSHATTVDSKPQIVSITRYDGITYTSDPNFKTNARDNLVFLVTFDRAVTAPAAEDFAITRSTAVSCGSNPQDPSDTFTITNEDVTTNRFYRVTVNLQDNGEVDYSSVHLDLNDTGTAITSTLSGDTLVNTSHVGESYHLNTCPVEAVNVTSGDGVNIYGEGQTVNLSVTFNKKVKFDTSSFALDLSVDPTARSASFNGTVNTLDTSHPFKYTVANGDLASDLEYASASPLSGASNYYDEFGNSNSITAILFPSPATTGSLGTNADIHIDGSAPSDPSSVGATFSAIPYNFTSSVSATLSAVPADGSGHVAETGVESYIITIFDPSSGQDVATKSIAATTALPAFNTLELKPNSVYEYRVTLVDGAGNKSGTTSYTWTTVALCGDTRKSSCYDDFASVASAPYSLNYASMAKARTLARTPSGKKLVYGTTQAGFGLWVEDLNGNNVQDFNEVFVSASSPRWLRADGTDYWSAIPPLNYADIEGRSGNGLYYTKSNLSELLTPVPLNNFIKAGLSNHTGMRNRGHCDYANENMNTSNSCAIRKMRLPTFREVNTSNPAGVEGQDSCRYGGNWGFAGTKGVPPHAGGMTWTSSAAISDGSTSSYISFGGGNSSYPASNSNYIRCVSNYNDVKFDLEDQYYALSNHPFVININNVTSTDDSYSAGAISYACHFDDSINGRVGFAQDCSINSHITFDDNTGLLQYNGIADNLEIRITAFDSTDTGKTNPLHSEIFNLIIDGDASTSGHCVGSGLAGGSSCFSLLEDGVVTTVYTKSGKKLSKINLASGNALVSVKQYDYVKIGFTSIDGGIVSGPSSFNPFLAADGSDKWSSMSPYIYFGGWIAGRADVGVYYTTVSTAQMSFPNWGSAYMHGATVGSEDMCNFANSRFMPSSPCKRNGMRLPNDIEFGLFQDSVSPSLSLPKTASTCDFDGNLVPYGGGVFYNDPARTFVPRTALGALWSASASLDYFSTGNSNYYSIFGENLSEFTQDLHNSSHYYRCVAR